jgi:hypothetical protein
MRRGWRAWMRRGSWIDDIFLITSMVAVADVLGMRD